MPPSIAYEPDPRLPPLAWCAHARRDAPIRVRCGTGVETRDEGFVEGAWDGDFGAFAFDRAEVLAGSGGRLRDGVLAFIAPFHPLERLHLLRGEGEVRVSNSLAFVLADALDRLDPAHPGCFFDVLAQSRRGIAGPPARLPTVSGRVVELHPCCELHVRADASVRPVSRSVGAPPRGFAEYEALLVGTLRRLAANAADPRRRAAFRLVAACSRGYDSTATATIASRVGCREGVTFVASSARRGHPLAGVTETPGDDSGADTLRRLGMTVHEFDRGDLARLPGHPRAEFFLSSPAAITDAAARLMEPVLRGSLFVSGRHGERYWGPTRRCRRRDFAEIDDCLLSGHALGEFRLRASFVHVPLPYVGARHGPAIHDITRSAEMRPWRLGTGYYDRPIPRRIAEEAGVPRAWFGQRKLGAGTGWRELSAESERDFQAFLAREVPPEVLRTLDPRPVSVRHATHRVLGYVRAIYGHWPGVAAALDLLGAERAHMMWRSTAQYHFHWGCAKTMERYARP